MRSDIFHTNRHARIEKKIVGFLNGYPEFLGADTVASTRAAGDAIQHILQDNFERILGAVCDEYSASFARRAMADLAFTDHKGLYYVVDVKTHRLETQFNMPNLTSVQRLARFYEDDANYFVVLLVAYRVVSGTRVEVELVHFVPIEFLSWRCLTIGALGWGQIQIANANDVAVHRGYSRKAWMLELCDALFQFYPQEIEKVRGRMDYFKKIRSTWEEKADVWK